MNNWYMHIMCVYICMYIIYMCIYIYMYPQRLSFAKLRRCNFLWVPIPNQMLMQQANNEYKFPPPSSCTFNWGRSTRASWLQIPTPGWTVQINMWSHPIPYMKYSQVIGFQGHQWPHQWFLNGHTTACIDSHRGIGTGLQRDRTVHSF